MCFHMQFVEGISDCGNQFPPFFIKARREKVEAQHFPLGRLTWLALAAQ